ncbi:MAG: hypothetical protein HPKKFMNG_02840 [Planctomycetes bacterium]|nr:hypothetical protein [Planctomycetota bacterium]
MRLALTVLGSMALALAACAAPARSGPNSQAGTSGKREGKSATDAEPLHATAAADAQGPWRHEASIERGVAFLLQHQNNDGSFGAALPERPADIYTGGVNSFHAFGNASSALCCMALLAQTSGPGIDEALKRGYRFLVSAPNAARVRGDTFYNTWAQAYMLEALARGLADTRLESLHGAMRERARLEMERLFKLQSLDGGFGYYDFGWNLVRPTGNISTPMTTSAALVALRAASDAGFDVPRHEVTCALDYMERMRVPNGAFLYSTGHKYRPLGDASMIRGSLGRSQAGNCALAEWDRTLTPKDLHRGMETFFREHVFIEIGRCRQYPHEAWYATAPYYYYFGHYYAARNLAMLPPAARAEMATRLADTVARTQFDDGSFWDYPLFGYTKAYGTGFGVLIMSHCRAQLQPAR